LYSFDQLVNQMGEGFLSRPNDFHLQEFFSGKRHLIAGDEAMASAILGVSSPIIEFARTILNVPVTNIHFFYR